MGEAHEHFAALQDTSCNNACVLLFFPALRCFACVPAILSGLEMMRDAISQLQDMLSSLSVGRSRNSTISSSSSTRATDTGLLLPVPGSLDTSSISIVSHDHGRLRREERGIERRELQEAVKYGKKERANPGRNGSSRWRYTYKVRGLACCCCESGWYLSGGARADVQYKYWAAVLCVVQVMG